MADRPRRYHAPGREARARATRAQVLAVAHDLFSRRGFAATVAEVSDQAGVSRATIELIFGTKAALLDAVIDVALAGDDEPVPILERPWVEDLDRLAVQPFLTRVADRFAVGAGRVVPVLYALDEGSARSPVLADLADRLRRQRLVMAEWVVSGVTRRGALADDLTDDDAIEIVLVLIDPLVLRRLLIERGWPTDRLASWLSRSLQRLLLAPDPTIPS